MIAGIGNGDVFILIGLENVGMFKITCLEKSHITWDNQGGGCY